MSSVSKTTPVPSVLAPSATVKRTTRAHSAVNVPTFNKSDVAPVIVPRNDLRSEVSVESRKEVDLASRTMPFSLQSKAMEARKLSNGRDETDQPSVSGQSDGLSPNSGGPANFPSRSSVSTVRGPFPRYSSAERKTKDESSTVSGKHDIGPVVEPPAPFIEICMYFMILKYIDLNLLHFSAPVCLAAFIDFNYTIVISKTISFRLDPVCYYRVDLFGVEFQFEMSGFLI